MSSALSLENLPNSSFKASTMPRVPCGNQRLQVADQPNDSKFIMKTPLRNVNGRNHSFTYSNENLHTGDVCDKNFARIPDLKCHLLVHERKDEKQQTSPTKDHDMKTSSPCNVCQKRFFSVGGLRQHLLGHIQWRHYSCESCGMDFNRKSHLKRHLIVHSPNRIKMYGCNVCVTAFHRIDHLKRHLSTHCAHSKVHRCQECGKCFSQMGGLKRHLLTHCAHSKVHRCQECGKCFSQMEHLKRHLLTHCAHSKVHRCQECGKCLSRKENLKRHLLTHCAYPTVHRCQECGKCYSRMDKLKRHLHLHSDKTRLDSFKRNNASGSEK